MRRETTTIDRRERRKQFHLWVTGARPEMVAAASVDALCRRYGLPRGEIEAGLAGARQGRLG